ncbi:Flp pilus assembly protein TadB [Propionibacterium cyclohexanicum]|uniref:Flp pilus assembly protein TadB n=1 Tax=Propionibacterium cyclohexanicum TaxID=64702 RepID=A0A1H9TH11_9ACTN|nr:type II secretion system F family protein [Propionibacterium cyclohexanicum]SER96505.1 Flp pilus assembly protein TadB [Propionibacterium cyclohexanicum]
MLSSTLAAVSVAALIVGLFVAAEGMRPIERGVSPGSSTVLWKSVQTRWTRGSRTQRLRLAVGAVFGLVLGVVTGSALVAVVVAGLVLILPSLLSTPVNRDMEVLQALDRWVRLLIGSVSTGKSLPDAVRATRGQVAPILARPVAGLIDRLDSRWPPEAALRGLADEFASPDADAVIAAMIVATNRGGNGSTTALRGLGEHTKRRLQALREIDTERAKPRVVVRQITVITLAVLGGVAVLNPEYLAPYRSPTGQLLGLALFAGYLGALLMLRSVARPRPRERILRGGDLVRPIGGGGDD